MSILKNVLSKDFKYVMSKNGIRVIKTGFIFGEKVKQLLMWGITADQFWFISEIRMNSLLINPYSMAHKVTSGDSLSYLNVEKIGDRALIKFPVDFDVLVRVDENDGVMSGFKLYMIDGIKDYNEVCNFDVSMVVSRTINSENRVISSKFCLSSVKNYIINFNANTKVLEISFESRG